MAAHQAPPSLGFSRQEHWGGLPFPSPVHESEKWKWSLSVVSDPSRPHELQPTRLLHLWDFPGKSTGVGCHCLFPLWSGVSHKLPMWFKTRESDNSSTYMNCCFILFWGKGYSGELRYPLLQSVFSPNLGQTMVIYLQLAIASIFAAHFKNGRPSGTSNAFSSWEKSGRGPLPLGDQYPGNLTL